MPKTRDVPRELLKFNTLFNQITYRHDASRVFDDFLSIIICCFARETQEDWYFETIRGYSREELDTFAQMMGELLKVYHQAVNNEDWTDPLGEYYEVLAGKYKKSNLGQFFTPKSLFDVMSALTQQGSDWDSTVNDCACGSGRLLLSANKITKDMYHVGQDLDLICAKMAAINLCLHRMKGVIYCMDTLRMTEPRRTFHINPRYHEHR